MLCIKGIVKRYENVTAVDNVSLEIPDGQMVGIIGCSGAGKSTLLRLINRLIDPCNGKIVYNDTDITALRGKQVRRWRAKCAMIFQQFHLVDRLDVLTNVLIGRINDHADLPSMFKRFSQRETALAVKALDRLGMVDQALQRAETLSGGQQQRVAIARALIQQPKIVLADEPIASLDPHNATKVMDALKSIHREEGKTVITNLHTLDTARTYADRIIGMQHGRVVFDGRPDDLTDQAILDIYGIADPCELDPAITSLAVSAEKVSAAASATA
jgi:phosphonate transport system ATP-binding protein